MLFRLGCLFVLVPLVELALLIQVGQWIGLGPTLAIVVATGIAGAALARREGVRALTAVQTELAQGRLPGESLMDGAAVLVGGAFLLTPGILTDLAGFLLLVPTTRRLTFSWLRRRLERALKQGTLRVSVWNMGRGPGAGGSGPGTSGDVSGPHGRASGFPFSSGGRRPGEKSGSDDDDPPARPGEIVQE